MDNGVFRRNLLAVIRRVAEGWWIWARTAIRRIVRQGRLALEDIKTLEGYCD